MMKRPRFPGDELSRFICKKLENRWVAQQEAQGISQAGVTEETPIPMAAQIGTAIVAGALLAPIAIFAWNRRYNVLSNLKDLKYRSEGKTEQEAHELTREEMFQNGYVLKPDRTQQIIETIISALPFVPESQNTSQRWDKS